MDKKLDHALLQLVLFENGISVISASSGFSYLSLFFFADRIFLGVV